MHRVRFTSRFFPFDYNVRDFFCDPLSSFCNLYNEKIFERRNEKITAHTHVKKRKKNKTRIIGLILSTQTQ